MADSKKFYRLGKEVLARHFFNHNQKSEHFLVDWQSNWEFDRIIEVGIEAVRGRNSSRWRIATIELPADTPQDDIDDILNCHWYVFDQNSMNRKCPPVIATWNFNNGFWVAVCEPPTDEKQVPFAAQIAEMPPTANTEWQGINLIKVLRVLGPGICTAVTENELLKFDILENGVFAHQSFDPQTGKNPGRPADVEILVKLQKLLSSAEQTGIIVRSFCKETICIRDYNSTIVRTLVKEIRGFTVTRVDNGIYACRKLTPEEVYTVFNTDAVTGKRLRPPRDVRYF
ncbi:MAG: hypothetical protein HPY90_05805 [Syntrophothermus sp.]|uniref:hypothetical protein n=1 Tax=Syntrophothermus sp. TaxID=2736299 RepID=UPI002579E948|nr:hypothetical protein [Syntrophothermus sp.]NSW82780.1 hypothetical protein [Syntrophothermus sp.]